MATQVEQAIAKGKSLLGSHSYDNLCQRFVRICYEAAGIYGSAGSAREACNKWKQSSSKTDIPVGAAVYFFNSSDGHVGIYLGNSQMIHAWGSRGVITSSIDICSNYQGWGWQGGTKPTGAGTVTAASTSDGSGTSDGSTETATTKVEITSSVVKSIIGNGGTHKFTNILSADTGEECFCELLIENKQVIYQPVLKGDVKVTWERTGTPGKLTFSVIKDDKLNFLEGNPVRLRVNGVNFFYGYVFSKSRTDNEVIDVTAYDQLRYFKNKDSYIYTNKKYSELVKMVADDYNLTTGDITDTEYTIPQRVEDGALFDILGNASDLTVIQTGKTYVLYDDFGKICLKNIEDMLLTLYVDERELQSFEYKTSIDDDVYNRVKIAVDNDETGEREFYIFNDEENQSLWGILQDYETMEFGTSVDDIKVKGAALLKYYNVKSRELKLKNVFGNLAVRAGNSIMVGLNIGDMILSNYMVVDKVEHVFSQGKHFMSLNVTGSKTNE